jgi:penicillin-binding protein 2
LARSCNVFFFDASRKLGPEALVKWCRAFRFGELTGVDLPFEQRGHVPAPSDNGPQSRYQWYPGDNLGLAIGQSYLSVTPLQLLVMTAAIANGGELIRPVTVNRVVPDESQPTLTAPVAGSPENVLGRLELRSQTLTQLRRGMEQVVEDRTGTAFTSVRSAQVKIAGKTGTAQTGINRPNHVWFVGYAPADAPQYAFVVLLEQGGAGGSQAGPLAREIVEKMLELELIYSRQASR